MDDTALIIPYFNHCGSGLIRQRFGETVSRLRQQTPHIFCAEASARGSFDWAGLPGMTCLPVRSRIWYKENLINATIRRLPAHFTKVAWLDGDTEYLCDNLPLEISRALDDTEVVQIGSQYEMLELDGRVSSTPLLAVYSYLTHQPCHGGPGLCWAGRRESLAKVGFLPEHEILGGGDWSFAQGVLQLPAYSVEISSSTSADYREMAIEYIEKLADSRLSYDYIDITVRHYFHADYSRRMYGERNRAGSTFRRSQLSYNEHGLLELDNPVMQAGLDEYYAYRDSIPVDQVGQPRSRTL